MAVELETLKLSDAETHGLLAMMGVGFWSRERQGLNLTQLVKCRGGRIDSFDLAG